MCVCRHAVAISWPKVAQRKVGFPECRYTCNGCCKDNVARKECGNVSFNKWHANCLDAFRAGQNQERNALCAKQAEQRTAEAEASSRAMQAAHQARLTKSAKEERHMPYQ